MTLDQLLQIGREYDEEVYLLHEATYASAHRREAEPVTRASDPGAAAEGRRA